ncbi:MAG: phosphodiester glycosidase family protein [Acidimicrobiales bacterium]
MRPLAALVLAAGMALLLTACSPARSAPNVLPPPRSGSGRTTTTTTAPVPTTTTTTTPATPTTVVGAAREPAITARPLAVPASLVPFVAPPLASEGVWRPTGRRVDGIAAVYETSLRPPGSSQQAGVAWMDTHLLAARLYSGSISPGGGPWRYTAPIEPAAAQTLVAAFNGGFKMADAEGGYYTQGKVVVPLRNRAASLVIYANGSVDIGAWGKDVTMTPSVVAVRQNLVPLVSGGQPSSAAASSDWEAWGSTIANADHQWRSGLGITSDGALVYVTGAGLDPLQLAQLLVRAGALRAMQLDINPDWTVFASYAPAPGSLASPANGSKLVAATVQGPWTFFESWWARDFVTMSARSGAVP